MKMLTSLITLFFTLTSLSVQAQKAPVPREGFIHDAGRALFGPNIDSEAAKPSRSRRVQEEEAEARACPNCITRRTVVVHPVVETRYVTGETKHISFGDPTPKVTEETVIVPRTHHIHYKYGPVEIIKGPQLPEQHTEETVKIPRTHTVHYEYAEVETIEEQRPEEVHTEETRLVPQTHTIRYEYAQPQVVNTYSYTGVVYSLPVAQTVARTITFGVLQASPGVLINGCIPTGVVVGHQCTPQCGGRCQH